MDDREQKIRDIFGRAKNKAENKVSEAPTSINIQTYIKASGHSKVTLVSSGLSIILIAILIAVFFS